MNITLPNRICKLAAVLLLASTASQAQQLKLGTNPTAVRKSALLELESTTQGLLLTRISDTTSATSPLKTAPDGTLIYYTPDNSLYIRSLAAWNKVSTGTGTGSITLSGDLTGTGTGTVPATINNQAVTFGKIQNINTQRLLGRYTAGAGSTQEITLNSSLGLTAAGALYADSAQAIWNASKLQSRRILDTVPGTGDVLKWNPTRAMWLPSQDITGGASYGNLADNDIRNATAPDAQYRMKIWASPITNTVQNGPLGTGAYAWSVLSFQMQSGASAFTTQLYFDKNTLALKEWGGVTTLTSNAGNPWYKVVTTHGDNSFTDGGIIFAGKTSDANTEVRQDAANFFWNNTDKRLGVGTNAPTSAVDVNGSFALPIRTVTASTTVTADDYTIIRGGTSNTTHTITLPAASSCTGRIYVIKRISANGTVNITSAGGNVDGSATLTMTATAYLSYMVQSDGTNWYTLSRN